MRLTSNPGLGAPQASHYQSDWTVQTVEAAKHLARSGSYWLAWDLYSDLLGQDDRHHGALSSVAQSVLGLPSSYQSDGDKRRKSRLERETEQDAAEMLPLSECVSVISSALSLGVGLAQLVPWRRGESGRWLPRLRSWPLRDLRWCEQSRRWKLQTDRGEVEVETGSGEWALFTPYGALSPWDRGHWRACSLWVLVKKLARAYWGRENELAGGIRKGGLAGNNTAERRRFFSDLQSLGAEGVVVLPDKASLEILQSHPQTHETFKAHLDVANAAIATAIKGESLSSGIDGQGGLGGGGVAQVQRQVSEDRAAFVARAWEEFVRAQVLTPWARINYGPRTRVPALVIQDKPEEDQRTKGEAWKALGEGLSALVSAGVPVDAVAAAEAAGVPLLAPTAKTAPVVDDAEHQEPATPEADKEEDATEEETQNLSALPAEPVSVFIALFLPPDAAARLALPGGEPAENLHITLAYLRAAALSASDRAALSAVCASLAAALPALFGEVGGSWGCFPPSPGSDGRRVWVAWPEVAGLETLRVALLAELARAGLPLPADKWCPHVTIQYGPPGDSSFTKPGPNPARVPVSFSALSLVVGGERVDFPFSY